MSGEEEGDEVLGEMAGPMPGPSLAEDEGEEGEEDLVGPMPGPMPGPASEEGPRKKKRKRNLPYERTYLDALPCSQMYERSYMHRDDVTHVVCVGSRSDFVITASKDGFVKFWKKAKEGIEFVKVFRAHLTHIAAMACSVDGDLLATVSEDRTAKIFDVSNFDMISMVNLHDRPTSLCWASERAEASSQPRLAIGFASGRVHVIDHLTSTATRADGPNSKGEAVFKGHRAALAVMAYNPSADAVVSIDRSGAVEYWRAAGLGEGGDPIESFPKDVVKFEYKSDTHLFELQKAKCTALSLCVSKDGKHFACACTDSRIRLFSFATGKLRRVYDETVEASQELQDNGPQAFRLEGIDFGRRLAVEKKYQAALGRMAAEGSTNQDVVATPGAVFDDSGNFLLYSTLLGVKVVNLHTNKVVRVLGQVENTERFTHVALYQGAAQSSSSKAKLSTAIKSGSLKSLQEPDPIMFACAFKKQRFYLFTRREPEDFEDVSLGRDVFNEKPVVDDFLPEAERAGAKGKDKVAREATIFTTGEFACSCTHAPPSGGPTNPLSFAPKQPAGDIKVELFPDRCPRTVENWTQHSRNSYYDGVIFHRVIKGFMIQTGDPLGDGTGGESIWGQEFEDEIDRDLRFDRPYVLAMANAGPNTNGSQFFITTAACPWLDGKHTIFGRVTKGADVAYAIERVRTDDNDKPYEDVKIVNILATC